MTLPVFSLPTSGTDPKNATKENLEASVNKVIALLHSQISTAATGLNPRGSWTPVSGAFPSGSSKADYWIVSEAGSFDGESFAVGDWLVSLLDSASVADFAENWFRADYSQIVPQQYATTTELALSTTLIDGQRVTVTRGYNGGPETFWYDAASTAIADGMLIVDATGMGVGQFISRRTTYGSFAEMDNDTRSFPNGKSLAVLGVGDFLVVGTGGFEMTSGRRVRPLPENGAVSTAHFGVPDSTTVSAVASLKAAIEYVALYGLRLIGVSGQTHLIDTSVTCDCTVSKPFEIDMNGAQMLYEGAATKFTIEGGTVKPILLTGISANRGDPLLAVTDATGIFKGDFVEITNPAFWSGTSVTVHAYTVDETDGNDIYIDGIIQGDIKNQQVIDAGASGSISGEVFSLSPSLKIKNWRSVIEGEDTQIDQCCLVRGFSDLSLDNCSLTGHTRTGFYAYRCSRVRFKGGWLAEMGYLDKNEEYGESGPSSPGGTNTSFGYGLVTARCSFVYVDATMAGQGWHAVDFASGTMVAVVDGGIYARNALALSMHDSSWHITLQNVVICGGEVGGGGRAAYVHYRNSTFDIDTLKNGINGLTGMWDFTIEGCTFNTQFPETSTITSFINSTSLGAEPGHGMHSVGYRRKFTVERNRFNGRKRIALGFNNSAFTLPSDLIVRGNYFYKPEGVVFWGGDITVIEDNTVLLDGAATVLEVRNLRSGMDLFFRRNNVDNLGTSGAGAVKFTGDGGVGRFYVDYNTISGFGAGFDFSMTSATAINSIIGNVARGASFLCYSSPVDTHTADAVVNNVWDGSLISFGSDLIVTTAAQNVTV